MHKVLPRLVLLWLCYEYLMDECEPLTQIRHGYLNDIGHSYGCPSVSNVTLTNMDKTNGYQITMKHNNAQTVYSFY